MKKILEEIETIFHRLLKLHEFLAIFPNPLPPTKLFIIKQLYTVYKKQLYDSPCEKQKLEVFQVL